MSSCDRIATLTIAAPTALTPSAAIACTTASTLAARAIAAAKRCRPSARSRASAVSLMRDDLLEQQRAPGRELNGHVEILNGEHAAGLGGLSERQSAVDAVAAAERDDEQRARAQHVVQPVAVSGVEVGTLDHLGHPGDHQRPAVPHRVGDRCVAVKRNGIGECVAHLHPSLGVTIGDREQVQGPVVEHVHTAHVRERRHRERDDALEKLADLPGRAQKVAHSGEELGVAFAPGLLGDILDDEDRARHALLRVADRYRRRTDAARRPVVAENEHVVRVAELVAVQRARSGVFAGGSGLPSSSRSANHASASSPGVAAPGSRPPACSTARRAERRPWRRRPRGRPASGAALLRVERARPRLPRRASRRSAGRVPRPPGNGHAASPARRRRRPSRRIVARPT